MKVVSFVEERAITRAAIARSLGACERVTSVKACENMGSLLSVLADSRHMDLCLIALSRNPDETFREIDAIHHHWPSLPIILFADKPDGQTIIDSLRHGICGFTSLSSEPAQFRNAVKTVLAGGRSIDSPNLEALLRASEQQPSKPAHEQLSNREFEIMTRLARGESPKQIAIDLGISAKTVSTYRRRTLQKLGFDRNAQLTDYILRTMGPDALA